MPTVSLEDGSLYYEHQGSGPPLVFIHGGWQDSDSWAHQIEYFAEDYHVISYDIRGHGRTGETDTAEYSIDLFADDLEILLQTLDIEQPTLVGMSVGGMIAQAVLGRQPDRIRGVVVGGPVQSVPSLGFAAELNPFISPKLAVSQMVSTLGSAGAFRALLDGMKVANGGPWLSLDSAVREQAINAAGAVSKGEYTKIFQALHEHEPTDLSHVETPLLVLHGDHEATQVKRQGKRLAETVPNGYALEIPDAAHLVNQDNPSAFNTACAEFFAPIH